MKVYFFLKHKNIKTQNKKMPAVSVRQACWLLTFRLRPVLEEEERGHPKSFSKQSGGSSKWMGKDRQP